MNFKFCLISAFILSLSGCQKEQFERADNSPEMSNVEVRFGSKITTRMTNETWETDDHIGIFMVKTGEPLSSESVVNNASNMKYTFSSGNAFEPDTENDRKSSRSWWNNFWIRSFIESDSEQAGNIAHNYTLFRYMLGCNAYGTYPTKFNGGLFTFDPVTVDANQAFTPDYRKWGGGTMTAQNQRLVYWGMLKSGDFDMMPAQFDFYRRMLDNAELRSLVYWGHSGGCFCVV